jgi:hypothetical protein
MGVSFAKSDGTGTGGRVGHLDAERFRDLLVFWETFLISKWSAGSRCDTNVSPIGDMPLALTTWRYPPSRLVAQRKTPELLSTLPTSWFIGVH